MLLVLPVFNKAQIDLSKPLIASCLTGLTACGLAAAAHRLSKENVPVSMVITCSRVFREYDDYLFPCIL